MCIRWSRLVALLAALLLAAPLVGCPKKDDSAEDDDDDNDNDDDNDDDNDKKKKKKKKKKKGKKKKKKGDGDDDDDDNNDDDDDDDDDDDGKDDGKDESAKPEVDKETAEKVMAGAVYKTVPSTNVEVPIPPGWKTKKAGLYSMAMSPDGNAFIAFTTVSSKGEFVGRIQHVVKTFDVEQYKKRKDVNSKIGPDKMPAFIQDATCRFAGHPATMSSILVDSGSRHKVFVVYALAQKAPDKTRKQALGTVLLLRKKR